MDDNAEGEVLPVLEVLDDQGVGRPLVSGVLRPSESAGCLQLCGIEISIVGHGSLPCVGGKAWESQMS
ncbi:hypothetical protein HMPREF9205_0056 [Cutibacterium acnes SK182]|nr:hypothetical protein HMPREF9205_0056 [Cutibacterium acnes SK182]